MSTSQQPLVVGQRIRVAPLSADGISRRALILALDDDDKLEIEYEGSGGAEEDVVPITRCSPLLPFELVSEPAETPTARAEQLKVAGNSVFKLRDSSAAIEYYVAALKALQADAPLSAGARCLVKPASGQSGPLRSAMALTFDDTSVDVEYERDANSVALGGRDVTQRLLALTRMAEEVEEGREGGGNAASSSSTTPANGGSGWLSSWWSSSSAAAEEDQAEEEEDEEEDGVARERVVLVVHGSQPALQCALLLNSAKASMLVQEWPTALARAMRAERIAAHDAVEPEKTRALRRTALIVCARCHLAMSKFGKATTFAARLLAADLPPGADEKAQAAATKEFKALLRDIQRRAAEVKRSNKNLAKALSAFVQEAMAASGQELPMLT